VSGIASSLTVHCQVSLTIIQPAGGGFQTAHELGQQRKRVLKISTGSKQLDTILGG
jgi:RecA/RadA recombinase